MNLETMVSSLLFYGDISISDYEIQPEMILDKNIQKYIKALQAGVESGSSQYDISQRFISKNKLEVASVDFVKRHMELYSKDTIMEMFYTVAMENIWKRERENKSMETSSLQDIYESIEHIKTLITRISAQKVQKNPFEHFRKEMELLREQRQKGEFEEGIVGLSTSIYNLDKITGGLKVGDYIVLGGRPSMGKTSLALDIAIDNTKSGKSVLVMSIEMRGEQLIQRSIPKVNSSLRLSHSVYGEDIENKIEHLMEASRFLEDSGIEIEDFSDCINVTSLDIQRVMQKYFDTHGFYPDLVVIDYIQKIQSTQKGRSENEVVTEVSNMIQRLGKSTKSTFLVLSQLNRSLEERPNKRPIPSDLRNSGAIEQDADIIMFVYREAVYLANSLKEKLAKKPDSQEIAEALRRLEESEVDAAEIIVAKNRNGPIGTAFVEFHKPTASYMQSADMLEDIV